MNLMIEELIELLLDGEIELSQNKKTPKILKYPLIIIILLIYLGTISITIITSILLLKESPLISIILLIICTLFIVYTIYKFKVTYIKRNPSSEMTEIWKNFVENICTKKLKDLTDIQKNAVLCFYYDSEMSIGGHTNYFDNYQKVNNDSLKKSLEIVANKKYVKNFEEAIAHGKEDNYEKTDKVYKKITPCLTEYIENYLYKNKDVILKEKKEIF